jgi:transposase
MATIRKQRVGKYTYWQIVESKRVNGKPRPVVVAHLGTAEQLLYKLKGGPVRKEIRSASHGAVQVFWQTAAELDLFAIFDRHFSKQVRDGLTVGQSLLLAAIHRAIKPDSKRAFASWVKQTTLPELIAFNPERLDSQHFWEQMDTVTEEQMEKAEKEITQKLCLKGLLSSKLLFYDLTNFFTYIATTNEKSKLAQRGRNKQKRNDLRQFGLLQVATREFLIPVLSHVYEGNKSDQELFISSLTKIRKMLSELNFQLEEFTIVFDKGSNSKNNFKELDQSKLPYVASLTATYHEDLLAIPLSYYQTVTVNGKDCLCYRTKKKIWGKDRTIVITPSEKLRQGQLRGLKQALTKKQGQLQELKQKLNSPRAKERKRQGLEDAVQSIIKGERGQEILHVSITDKGKGRFDLDWAIDNDKYRWITENLFGKKLLVTCRDDWSSKEIIAAYHGQSNIERIFKHLKNPYHNAVHPQYHWTDQKIKVHTFICLIGLLLSQVIWKKAREAGYVMTIETLIDKLTEVRKAEIVTVTSVKGKPQKETQLEQMEPELQNIYETLTAR